MENITRDQWKSKFGFILACIGSAVGMGNIWLFPFRVGQFGGAAFLIPYIIFVILIGYVGIVEEMCLGRGAKSGPMGAFEKATMTRKNSKAGKFIAIIPIIGSLGIAIGYGVVIAWIIRFTIGSFTGSMINSPNPGKYFEEIAGAMGAVRWHLIGLFICLVVMVAGISKGIEKLNKILMPTFFVMFLILAIRVFFLPNSISGYKFLLKADMSQLLNPNVWVYALGQAFFSLSLAGSGTVVYGSYLNDQSDAVMNAKYIATFDTIAAILAALVIIPAASAYNIKLDAGPPLMFITMPMVFQKMPGGFIFSIIFFVAVLFAGITSLVNLFETPIETLQTNLKLKRPVAVSIIFAIAMSVGIFIESGNVLEVWMNVISIYIIPLGALLAAIMFFWVHDKDYVISQVSKGRNKTTSDIYYYMGKYVFCGLTLTVYVIGIIFGGIG